MTNSETLIRQFQAERLQLLAYIRSLAGDPDVTEDIFQEVSVVVLQKAQHFEPGRDLQAWCRGIARNILKRERSRMRRLRFFEDDRLLDLVTAAFDENPELELLNARRASLRHCTETLSANSRQMVQLRYVDGLSMRALAEKFGRTEDAVQVGLSRIRRAISQCIERHQRAAATELSL
ncbi:MAG TPA: sigma-70 family RNA polymerase sigma factor [Planctomycetota bacterium]|nr:sigma-70 family RNA polymerase sigma factor [Planctomycetota bacterium]